MSLTDESRDRAFHLELASSRGISLTATEAKVAAELDRFGAEGELANAFAAGALSRDLLTHLVPEAWRYRTDNSTVPDEVFREMFLAARFTQDFEVAPRPRRAVLAFRGASPRGREGIAWTLDLDQAQYFARARHGQTATIWVCRIPADRILARYVRMSSENEVTADVRGLEITELTRLTPRQRLMVITRKALSQRSRARR